MVQYNQLFFEPVNGSQMPLSVSHKSDRELTEIDLGQLIGEVEAAHFWKFKYSYLIPRTEYHYLNTLAAKLARRQHYTF